MKKNNFKSCILNFALFCQELGGFIFFGLLSVRSKPVGDVQTFSRCPFVSLNQRLMTTPVCFELGAHGV
jgi:hypothetical protein